MLLLDTIAHPSNATEASLRALGPVALSATRRHGRWCFAAGAPGL